MRGGLTAFIPMILLAATAASAAPACRESPRLTGACFDVRGRLALGNGDPAWRIWPMGTHRMLGVVDGQLSPESLESGGLPPTVARATARSTLPNHAVWGTFTVCPLSPDRPGHMRSVCIADLK